MLGASVGTSGKKTQLEADERLGGQARGSDATAGQWGADAEGKRLALPHPVPRLRSAACGHSPSEQGPPLGPGLGPSSDKLAQKPGAGPVGAATGSPCRLIHRQKPRRATMPAVALPGPGPGPQDSRSAGGMPYLEEEWEGRETVWTGPSARGRPFLSERHSPVTEMPGLAPPGWDRPSEGAELRPAGSSVWDTSLLHLQLHLAT